MTDTRGSEALYHDLISSWNRRDAGAMAACFGPDGTMIGFDGSTVTGPVAIQEHLEPIFRDHPTASFVVQVQEIRPLAAEVELIRAIVGMVPPGGTDINPDTNAIQSLVARREGDDWRVALFQNTPAAYHGRPDLQEQHSAAIRDVLRSQPLA